MIKIDEIDEIGKHKLELIKTTYDQCAIGDLVMFYSDGRLKIGIKVGGECVYNHRNFLNWGDGALSFTGQFHSVYKVVNRIGSDA